MDAPTLRLLAVVLLTLSCVGCIGTDLVDELPSSTARVELDPTTTAVQRGDTVRFRAAYYDAFDVRQEDVALQWTSTDPAVARVDEQGLVTAQDTGQAMIIAEADDAISDPALFTVVTDPAAVARVSVSPDSVAIAPDEHHQFTAAAQNLSGASVEGRAFTWMSSDTTVATIDADGRATARAPGTAQITATTGGIASPPARISVASGSRREGTFTKKPGTSYEVEGTVTLETGSDGDLVVRLAPDFSTSQAPGVHIYLSASNAVSGTSLDLGKLRSFSGADTYVVEPSSVTLDTFDWVIIHCKPFNVTFGYAELQ